MVLDEFAYRLTITWLRADGDNDPVTTFRREPATAMRQVRSRLGDAWAALDELHLELVPSDQRVVHRARSLMVGPGLAPRDALHAAHAIEGRCEVVASSDPDFDVVTELRRLGP